MAIYSTVATALVGLEHIYILTLEMFLWNKPAGMKAFRLEPDFAEKTKALAANQGLYNGFLAAGLFWALAHPEAEFGRQLKLFFLGCVAVAGVYGGATANKRILLVQATPAIIGLALVLLKL